MVAPVSTVTFLVPPCVVLPRIDGGASVTVRSILIGGLRAMIVSPSRSAVIVVPSGMRCMFCSVADGVVIRSDGLFFGCMTAVLLRVYTNTYSALSGDTSSNLSDGCSVFVITAPVLMFFMRT